MARSSRIVVALLALVSALLWAGGASAYSWPIRPFFQPHPVRGNFGDPRTIFMASATTEGFQGPGSFSFHQGVDISAGAGTGVYPVASGVAHITAANQVTVESPGRGLSFQYDHIESFVNEGEVVTVRKTLLGTVLASAGHVHLTELRGGHALNPLERGHLTPYSDHTHPRVAEVEVHNEKGAAVGPLGVCGKIALAAEAFDLPAVPVPGAWRDLPVTPALVTWRIARLDGANLVPPRTAADFRATLPPNPDFWSVYARGTYQNAPRFGRQQFTGMPGRYLFALTPLLDTKTLPNGVAIVTVTAADTRGNVGTLNQRISILNIGTVSGCPPEPPPAPARRG